ncbi:MAG: glucose-6-phosphate isomerase [Dehalococcoidia bacterium]
MSLRGADACVGPLGPLGPLAAPVRARLEALQRERVVERLWAADHTLWSEQPDEITNRLGWLELDAEMADEAAAIEGFARSVADEGYGTAVLLGMGGASLAPAVLGSVLGSRRRGLRLQVLATTDPSAIRAAASRLDLARTLFIASSKSGTTIETRALLDYFWSLAPDGRHFVAITDAGTPLDRLGRERRFRRVFAHSSDNGPLRGGANVGGRYSALSYFGLVPAALAGAPLGELLARARAMRERCGPTVPTAGNPGAWLGAVLGEAALAGRDKLTLVLPDELAVLGAWLEQLVAESTGKDGRGIVPVNGEPLGTPAVYGEDRLFAAIEDAGAPRLARLERAGQPVVRLSTSDRAAVGGECYRWEFATAIAGHILGVHPFNQPNVQEAKQATQRILDEPRPAAVTRRPADLLATLRAGDYISLQAYARPTPRLRTLLQAVRIRLRDRHRVATTVGYGPALLHSTGQLHKGGPGTGIFLVYVPEDRSDLEIPGRAYSFGELKRAQALADLDCLQAHDRRVSRVTCRELEALAC